MVEPACHRLDVGNEDDRSFDRPLDARPEETAAISLEGARSRGDRPGEKADEEDRAGKEGQADQSLDGGLDPEGQHREAEDGDQPDPHRCRQGEPVGVAGALGPAAGVFETDDRPQSDHRQSCD